MPTPRALPLLVQGRTLGPAARRICPGRTVTVYGAKKTYPCGWESRIRALGTLYGGTRVSNCWCSCDAPCSPRLATCLPAALLPAVVRLPCLPACLRGRTCRSNATQ